MLREDEGLLHHQPTLGRDVSARHRGVYTRPKDSYQSLPLGELSYCFATDRRVRCMDGILLGDARFVHADMPQVRTNMWFVL